MEDKQPKQSTIHNFFLKKPSQTSIDVSLIEVPTVNDIAPVELPATNDVALIMLPTTSKRSHVELEHEGSPPLVNVIPAEIEYGVNIDLKKLPADPGLRQRISEYHTNIRDAVRREYLQNVPCRPNKDAMSKKKGRQFLPEWFKDFPDWLEYSKAKDVVFCLHCYLFRPTHGSQGGGDSFTQQGFCNWKKKEKLRTHVGGINSSHWKAFRESEALRDQNKHIETFFSRQTVQTRCNYRIRLTATVGVIRFLLRQGLAFRGHDESEESSNRGNFLELLIYSVNLSEEIKKVVLANAPLNSKLICPNVQKNVVNAFATETTNSILKDLGKASFSILVNESRDISIKEKMAIVIRYVDKSGCVIERFLGIVHVRESTAVSLKEAIEALFAKHSLSIGSFRGQGYDGASNMKGELNGLKTLILKENPYAFYVHCFAHQLQLALVAVAKKEGEIASFFNLVLGIVNVAGASCKRRDKLRDIQAAKVVEALDNGDITTGRGQNQEFAIKRHGDTRWSSHYEALVNLIVMFSSVIDVIEDVTEDGMSSGQRGEASGLLHSIQTFDFIFKLFLMKSILGIANSLSKALQRKDQDIVNAMALVATTKGHLQTMRNDGWGLLLGEIADFCSQHDIVVPRMEDSFVPWKRSQRRAEIPTYLHYYRVHLYIRIMDWQSQELDGRFDERSTELLLCVACLSPNNSFSSFDSSKLIQLARFYPNDFSATQLVYLKDELKTYIGDMLSTKDFSQVNGISGLAKKLVETKKHRVFPLVYLLITLALILPVATATVERAFSAMRILKSRLRNPMGDEWMNDYMVTYIEKDVFDSVDTEAVIQRYQNKGDHHEQL